MIKYKIIFAPTAVKQLEKLEKLIQLRLANSITRLATNPFLGKKLQGDLKEYYSYRVGNYRIIYFIQHKKIQIEIIRVAHRKEVYRMVF